MSTAPDTRDPVRRWGCMAFVLYCTIAACILIMLAGALCGCTRTVYVPTESVRTEYRDRDVERVVTDTVRDERFVYVKGDTVLDIRDRWHHSTEYVRDTCYVELTDTIREPYPVERPLTRWQQVKMDLGGIALGALAAALCLAAVWLIRKFRR